MFYIKDIFINNWDSFVQNNTSTLIRPVVFKEVEKMMNCKNPDLGHAVYQCPSCGEYKFVPFTCKSRFCNSCGMKYQQDRALTLYSKLINCTHRHIVFTIPFELRNIFRANRTLLNLLFKAASQTILDWFYSQNKTENYKPGFVCALHTFGRDLKWNPHIHMLITEGATGNYNVWKKFKFFPYTMLRKKWQTTLLFLLEKHLGKSFKYMKNFVYSHTKDGFYVYAKPNLNSNHDVVNYIIRYIARPVMAQSRILNVTSNSITFWYQRHEDNKRVEETVSIDEFIKRLIVHIPDEQFKMLRYYGIYAKKHKNSDKLFRKLSTISYNIRKRLSRWRESIELSFHYDPAKCSCGMIMQFITICCKKKTLVYSVL